MRNTQEPCLYSDSKWCVDIFNNLQLYKRRGWIAKGKEPVRHHDIWEDIYQLLQTRAATESVTHVYGHNKLMYNEAADAPARVGAGKSTVRRAVRPMGPTDEGPRARRQKRIRTRGVKRHAAIQVSDGDSGSDRPTEIRHRRRGVQNAPLDIPSRHPEPD